MTPSTTEAQTTDQRDLLGSEVNRALFAPECDRLSEWSLTGPVQRAAVESFAQRLLAARATTPAAVSAEAAPFSQQRVAHLVGRLRDSSGGHINGLYDREAADMLDELAQLADSEGSRAVKYLRRAREAEARIAALEAAAVPLSDETVDAAAEAAYWQFDARRKGYAEWKGAPQSERDAFKAEARKLARGAFPTKVDGT